MFDIEQAAALKKLQSEAQFVSQQIQIEQNVALEKQQSEAQFSLSKEEAEVKTLVAQAELRRKRQDVETEADLFMDEQEHAALQKLQAKAKRMDQLESAIKGVSEEMTEWLAANRLQDYAAHMALIAGSYALQLPIDIGFS